MRRKVVREKSLPAFSVGIAELEILWQKLSGLFDDESQVYASLEFEFPNETIEFTNLHELRTYKSHRGKATEFKLWLADNGKRLSIRTGSQFRAQAEVSASSEHEAWCAGAVETVHSFLSEHKSWYGFMVVFPLGWLLCAIVNVPMIAFWFYLYESKISLFSPIFFAAWLISVVAITMLLFFRLHIFPAAVINFSEKENFLRKYAVELTFAVACLTPLLMIIGWYVS